MKQIRVWVASKGKKIVRKNNTNGQTHDKTQLQCNEQTCIKTQRLKLHPRKRVNVYVYIYTSEVDNWEQT